jgi:hypothetical protein
VTHRTRRAQRERARRDRARGGQDADDVLAQDELARDWLGVDGAKGSPGLLRRLAQGVGSGGAPASSVFVEIFAPTHQEANLVKEAQRLVGVPAPAPSDPPFLEPVGPEGTINRYRGRVVIRRTGAVGSS